MQADAHYPRSKKQFKQQRQHTNATSKTMYVNWKSTKYSTYEACKNFELFRLSILSEISPTEYVRQCQNSKEEIRKIGCCMVHVLWNMQNVAILCCCFVTFCKQRQRNEQRIIMHTYTAITLVAVAIKVCLINSLNPNKWQNNKKPNEHKTNESQAILFPVVSRKSLWLSLHRASNTWVSCLNIT